MANKVYRLSASSPAGQAIVYFSENWSAQNPNYRQQIREHLWQTLEAYKARAIKEDILDLTKIPKSDNFFISISHCPSLGGYAISNQCVGFDIELKNRVTHEAVARISTENELRLTDFRQIWAAKEASLKAFHNQHTFVGPLVISEVGIDTVKDQYFVSQSREMKAFGKWIPQADLGSLESPEEFLIAVAWLE